MANDTDLVERLTKSIGEAIAKGLADGLSMAEIARGEAARILGEKKRGFQPGPTCFKCRQPVNVCGGPEMVKVQDTDSKGNPVIKDGRPVYKKDESGALILVQATKDREADANHELMPVTVDDGEAEKYFRGVIINSVKYRSRSNGHKILVPKKNDIAYIASNFQKNEKDQRIGIVANHDSGVVSPGSGRSRFVPAHKAWR